MAGRLLLFKRQETTEGPTVLLRTQEPSLF